MRKLILYSMFLVLLTDEMFDLGFSFGRGLSIKNLYLYFIVAMIALDTALKPGDFKFTDLDIHVPFALLICYAILSWALSAAFSPVYPALESLIALKGGLVDHYLFFLAFRYGVRAQKDFLWLLRAIVGTLLASSIFTLVDFLDIPDFGIIGTYRGRVEGPIGAANQYGALLGFLLPLAIVLAPSRWGVGRIAWYLGILASALLLVATGSRGAYIALPLGAVVAALYLRSYLDMGRVARLAGLALLVTMVVGAAYALLRGDVLESIIYKTTAGDIGVVSSGRTDIWRAGLLVMSEWPLSFMVGLGWNAWAISGIWKSAHNIYLNHLFELGLIGLSLFVYLLHNLFRRARRLVAVGDIRLQPLVIAYVISLSVICIAILFSPIPSIWTTIWAITGTVFGLSPVSRESGAEAPETESGTPAAPHRGHDTDGYAGPVPASLKHRPGL